MTRFKLRLRSEPDGVPRLLEAGLVLLIIVSFIRLVALHAIIISSPFPLELREGASLTTSQLLLAGGNPFTPQYLPRYLNVYGIVYNLAVLPLARLYGPTFWIHRLFSAICIYSAVGLLIAEMIRKKIAPILAVAGGVCVLANLLYSVSPLARPDGLGVLLFLLASLLPWDQNFSPWSLVVSAILATAAFFTKQYFYLPVGILAVYLFLRVSKFRGLVFSVGCGAILLGVSLLVRHWYPYYFYNTMAVQNLQVVNLFSHTRFQLGRLGWLYLGMLLVGLMQVNWRAAWQNLGAWHASLSRFNWRQVHQPLYLGSIDYPLIALALSTLVILVRLGGNNGSKMVYLFQLMSPFLVIWVAGLASRSRRYPSLTCLLVGVTLVANLAQLGLPIWRGGLLPGTLPYPPQNFSAGWDRLARIVHQNQTILNSPLLTGQLVEAGKPFVDNGLSEYFEGYKVPPSPFLPDPEEAHRLAMAYRKQVLEGVRHKAFDKIVIDPTASRFVETAFLDKYYCLEDQLDVYVMQNRAMVHLEVWTRR